MHRLYVFLKLWIPCMIGISTFAGSYVVLETWAGGSSINLLKSSWPWPHPLISELTMVRAPWPVNTSRAWLKTAYRASNGAPTKAEERLLHPFVPKGEIAQPVPTKAFLQPAKTATQDSHHVHSTSWLCPPFLLVQNLSSKWIVPTDNMWPKLHDEYTRHQVKSTNFLLFHSRHQFLFSFSSAYLPK